MTGITMIEQNVMLQKAEEGIKAELGGKAPRASRDLIDSVAGQGVDEYFVRAALLFLLDTGRVYIDDTHKFQLA